MKDGKIRVLIVDDSRIMRDSLQQMISGEPDMTVAGTAKDGLEALKKIRELLPDVVLMDYNMPVLGGREVLPQIIMNFPAQKVLVFTICTDAGEIYRIFRLGAHGYLPKSSPISEIFKAIRQVAGGDTIIPNQVASALVDEFRRKYSESVVLQPEEIRIMNFISDGFSAGETAYRLFIPEPEVTRTVKRFLDIVLREMKTADQAII